jgi:hypothetical protein
MERVVHFEVHAENPERAAKFYADAFGWEIKKWDGPVEYWLVTTGPEGTMGINGGILRRKGTAPTKGQAVNAYVCTLGVTSLDESITKATAAGATMALPKMPIPGMGWLAYCKDTEGNLFGMMQSDMSAK